MRLRAALVVSLASLSLAAQGCSRFGAAYPPRPPQTAGSPVADPTPARVVAHIAMSGKALAASVDEAVPRTGDGAFALVGTERKYTWERDPFELAFSQGRLVLTTHVRATVMMPVGSLKFPIDLKVQAEPVVNTEYNVRLQSTDVKVTSTDRRLRAADFASGVFETLGAAIDGKLREFAYPLRPMIAEAYARVAKPIPLPLGEGPGAASGCAQLRVLGVEAGPTIVADGIEKDIALVVAPEVTMPCAGSAEAARLPNLANVGTLVPGPFTLTVPLAARYDELTRALGAAFTDGKLFFSKEYPGLYIEKPEVYESQGQLVLKVHLMGPVDKMGIHANLDGDIFFSGHPTVVDNEIRIPDLEQTIETKNFLLSLKAMTGGDEIRDQARAALRLDLGERLRPVREKLGQDLTFGEPKACFKGDVDKIEVTGVHAHASYLRVYVAVTGRAAASAPCPEGTLPAPLLIPNAEP